MVDVIGDLSFPVVQNAFLWIWLVAAGLLTVAAIPIKALEPVRKLLWPIVRRGKLLRSSDATRGVLLGFTLPQSFFTHFYIVGLVWNSCLLFTAFGFACKCSHGGKNEVSTVIAQLTGAAGIQAFLEDSSSVLGKFGSEAWRLTFLLALMEAHVMRRLYECLFVSSFQRSARISAFGYLLGIGFYILVPATLFVQSFQNEGYVNAFKIYLKQKLLQRSEDLAHSADNIPNTLGLLYFLGNIGVMPYIGACLCFYGFMHQHACHEILASLRTDDQSKSGKEYGIPRGDWFELVSCAHFLAEIVIYAGFLVASGGSRPVMYLVFAFVVSNLQLIAKPTHEWYLAKFDDYPTSRRPLFPYIG